MSLNVTTIHTGRWTNHAKGNILADVFTLSTRNATLLIAFIAIFNGWVGSVFWNLVAFLLHQSRARTELPTDGLHHQLQALLRNSNEPISFAQHVLSIGWSWRGRGKSPLLRVTPYALAGIAVSAIFAVAGIFSARLSSSGLVLLSNTNCGYFTTVESLSNVQAIDESLYAGSLASKLLYESIQYAQNCYQRLSEEGRGSSKSAQSTSGGVCNMYVRSTWEWTTKFGVDCPFADQSICSVPKSEIMQMDTGYLHSVNDIGLNTKASDSVLFRQVKTCSPITTNGFSNNTFTKTGFIGPYENLAVYAYGPSVNAYFLTQKQENITSAMDWINANNLTFLYPETAYALATTPYTISPISGILGAFNASDPEFIPDPRLTTNISYPVSLFFLANRAVFVDQPVEDAWFQATTLSDVEIGGLPVPMYQNNLPATVLGCVEQMQICNPNGTDPVCSDLNETWTQDSWELGFNDLQELIAEEIADMMFNTAFAWVAYYGSGDTLLASTIVGKPFSPSLPHCLVCSEVLEMDYWMAISSNWMQRTAVSIVTGPTSPELVPYWTLVSSPQSLSTLGQEGYDLNLQLCGAQMVSSTAYQSFSVFGICINFVIGGILVVIGVILRYGHSRLRNGFRALSSSTKPESDKKSRKSAWTVNGVLQLQRIAYEELELGNWEDASQDVPVTKEEQLFGRPVIMLETDGAENGKHLREQVEAITASEEELLVENMAMDSSASASTITTL